MDARDDLNSLRRTGQHTPVPTPAQPKDGSSTARETVSMPQASGAPGQTPSIATLLELVVTRDRMIQTELLRLQRTLSRQNFRGAESARRLVRKLARKAELNSAELESLIRSLR